MKGLATTREISAALSVTSRRVQLLAKQQGWPHEQLPGSARARGYRLADLPPAVQRRIILKRGIGTFDLPTRPDESSRNDAKRSALWAVFERKPDTIKAKATRRLELVGRVVALIENGEPKLRAVAAAAKESDVSVGAIRTWLALIDGIDRCDWLQALAPRWSGRTKTADCSPAAWEFIKTNWLRPEAKRRGFEGCYRDLERAAKANGWTIPAAKTLSRRCARELGRGLVTLAQDGADAAKKLLPPQERDRSVFHALQAVNIDGRMMDVFVRWEDDEVGRPVVVAIQDLYSGKILAWRVGRSESAHLVHLALSDMIESVGIPELIYMDNGRAFASKWISGGTANRYRFKVKADEPLGVLTLLNIKVHWTQVYSGQSKPIERAFGDFGRDLDTHLAFAGAYVGNNPLAKPDNYGSKAIAIDEYKRVIAGEIAAHNARTGRRAANCHGRSFDETFAESYAKSSIQKATAGQRRMLFLASETVSLHRDDNSIRLCGNRYWASSSLLVQLAGRKVVVRFDPDDLTKDIHVYDRHGRYLSSCQLVEKVGFNNVEESRRWNKTKAQHQKALKAQLRAELQMSKQEAAARMGPPPAAPAPEAKVVRPLFGSPSAPKPKDIMPQEDADRAFREFVMADRRRKGIEKA